MFCCPRSDGGQMLLQPHNPTIMIMTIEPAKIRWRRLRLGKYGSSAPVIGFIIVMGAVAVNWGRGRSWEKGGKASGVAGGCGPCGFGRHCGGPDPTSISSNSEQSHW